MEAGWSAGFSGFNRLSRPFSLSQKRHPCLSPPPDESPDDYDHVWTEWAMGNYVRVALILITVVFGNGVVIRICFARETAPEETPAVLIYLFCHRHEAAGSMDHGLARQSEF